MSAQRKRMRVYMEEAKARHTSHWDWDCMSDAEIEAALREARRVRSAQAISFKERLSKALDSLAALLRGRPLFRAAK